MQICMIADLHLGIKKGADYFLENQLRYFREELVPYLTKQGIKDIFILGDLYDTRNYINVKVKNAVYDLFAETLASFKVWMLLGNHDVYYRDNTTVHSLKFFKQFSNARVIEDVERIEIGGRTILLVPWQVDYQKFAERVAAKNIFCDVCMGHFDINGFKQTKTHVSEEGLSSELFFKNYGLTFSGHFHTRSNSKRGKLEIVYIGAPYHLDRNDIGEERGACILELDDLSYRFVNSEKTIKFVVVKYPEKVYVKQIRGNIVDVIVQTESKDYDEDRIHAYIKKIEQMSPIQPPHVAITVNLSDNGTTTKHFKTIQELMYEFVDGLNLTNKVDVVKTLQEIHEEAKHITTV